MNIYVYNCSNTYNYGSMMMGENFIFYFNKLSNVVNKFYVEGASELDIERLREATSINEIFLVPSNSLFKDGTNKYKYMLSYLNFINVTSEFINNIDLVVVLGGDDFTEDYGWKGPVFNSLKLNLLIRKGLKVIMVGQTMGPYYSFRKPIMKSLLKNINNIYPRDNLTFGYLKNLSLDNISITDDLALLPLSKQKVREKTKQYITFCPSELIYRYSKEGNREDWINFNMFMIDTIRNKYPDKKLILLAHVLKPESVDDSIMTNELYSLVKDKHANNIILESNEMYPYEVRDYIQQSLFTVSSRMHPVISSIQCEIPTIAISYSTKYFGIIGEKYELGDYIIDVRYLNYNEMKNKFIILIDKIEKKYDAIQEKMRDNNKLANTSIIKTLNEIINI